MADLGAIGAEYDENVDADRGQTSNPLPDQLNNTVGYTFEGVDFTAPTTKTIGIPING